jgi:hypothetical protein
VREKHLFGFGLVPSVITTRLYKGFPRVRPYQIQENVGEAAFSKKTFVDREVNSPFPEGE